MPEQFALHEGSDKRAAVDRHHSAPRVRVMDGARDDVFARSAFALQKHWEFRARRLFNQPADIRDCRGAADQPMIWLLRFFAHHESSRMTKAFVSPESLRILRRSSSAASGVRS